MLCKVSIFANKFSNLWGLRLKRLMEKSILTCGKLKLMIYWFNLVTQGKQRQYEPCSQWWKPLEVCRESSHLKKGCRNKASLTNSSKSVYGDIRLMVSLFFHERLVYPFWHATEEDVLLLSSPQNLHAIHGLPVWHLCKMCSGIFISMAKDS